MNTARNVGLVITRDQRLHFSYPDPVSAAVEQEYYGAGLGFPKTSPDSKADESVCEKSSNRILKNQRVTEHSERYRKLKTEDRSCVFTF
jgi:hypothetical protein